jgi:hypothetical protein
VVALSVWWKEGRGSETIALRLTEVRLWSLDETSVRSSAWYGRHVEGVGGFWGPEDRNMVSWCCGDGMLGYVVLMSGVWREVTWLYPRLY